MKPILVFFRLFFLFAVFTFSAQAQAVKPTHADLVFAEVDGQKLKLNLFLPEGIVEKPPLVIFIHGGGWSKGSYRACKVPWLTESGFAVASISYRLTDVATFPAQIHDVKAAVRWLRAHADEYNYDAKRIGVCGSSAGGHLAMLVGMSGDVPTLEGEVGEHLDQSSRVHAIVDYYGPSDFVLRSKTHPSKTEKPTGGAYQLLGGKASEQPEKSRLASPAFHVTPDDPPLLILHGTKDTTVLIDQAERILEVYQETRLPIIYHALPESKHGGAEFFSGENRERVEAFFSA